MVRCAAGLFRTNGAGVTPLSLEAVWSEQLGQTYPRGTIGARRTPAGELLELLSRDGPAPIART